MRIRQKHNPFQNPEPPDKADTYRDLHHSINLHTLTMQLKGGNPSLTIRATGYMELGAAPLSTCIMAGNLSTSVLYGTSSLPFFLRSNSSYHLYHIPDQAPRHEYTSELRHIVLIGVSIAAKTQKCT